ncbi:hypothetical protein [Paractinoplanes atraurantiacus]|uniref:Fimbrial assembly protein (PilN) n=1 Tax=Paractinoplanes atraurantiacus TaxID=1036182 RepID=A0A285H0A0_9ACTN|nr:hypothetical protein [Actinoplanes atraurantiacus]SNY29249.1 hypothetical protein SAMN05421748_103217 [Actinoplanes atraurantiacus]
MATSTTTLMPIDPAVSPEQASRVLPIRANLLPGELTAGRNARRTRFLLIGAVVVVIGVLAGWYAYAYQQHSDAQTNLDTANGMVEQATDRKSDYSKVTGLMNDETRVQAELKSLLASDTPWSTDFGYIRTDAAAAGVTLTELSGTLTESSSGSATATSVASITVGGTGSDKKKIASFIEKLAAREELTRPYASSVSYEATAENYSFALKVDLTAKALCGRFTTTCGTGD